MKIKRIIAAVAACAMMFAAVPVSADAIDVETSVGDVTLARSSYTYDLVHEKAFVKAGRTDVTTILSIEPTFDALFLDLSDIDTTLPVNITVTDPANGNSTIASYSWVFEGENANLSANLSAVEYFDADAINYTTGPAGYVSRVPGYTAQNYSGLLHTSDFSGYTLSNDPRALEFGNFFGVSDGDFALICPGAFYEFTDEVMVGHVVTDARVTITATLNPFAQENYTAFTASDSELFPHNALLPAVAPAGDKYIHSSVLRGIDSDNLINKVAEVRQFAADEGVLDVSVMRWFDWIEDAEYLAAIEAMDNELTYIPKTGIEAYANFYYYVLLGDLEISPDEFHQLTGLPDDGDVFDEYAYWISESELAIVPPDETKTITNFTGATDVTLQKPLKTTPNGFYASSTPELFAYLAEPLKPAGTPGGGFGYTNAKALLNDTAANYDIVTLTFNTAVEGVVVGGTAAKGTDVFNNFYVTGTGLSPTDSAVSNRYLSFGENMYNLYSADYSADSTVRDPFDTNIMWSNGLNYTLLTGALILNDAYSMQLANTDMFTANATSLTVDIIALRDNAYANYNTALNVITSMKLATSVDWYWDSVVVNASNDTGDTADSASYIISSDDIL